MKEEKDFIYLVWVQNTETKEFNSFFKCANNPDEALSIIEEEYFDVPSSRPKNGYESLFSIMEEDMEEDYFDVPFSYLNNEEGDIFGEDTEVLFPSEKTKIVKIRCFHKDVTDGFLQQQRYKDEHGIYKNKTK